MTLTNFGPKRPDEPIIPGEVDDLGGMSKSTGAGYDVQDIMALNARVTSATAVFGVLKPDLKRSAAVDMEELERVVGQPILSDNATVRGQKDDERVVTFLTQSESGRSVRSVISYDDLPESKAKYEDAVEQERKVALAARSAGGEKLVGEDPRTEVLSDQVTELQERLKEAERKAAAAEAKAAEPPAAAEPFEGYEGLSETKIRDHLAGIDDYLDREFVKRAIRDFEPGYKNRSGVLALAEPDAAPAAPVAEGERGGEGGAAAE